MITYSETKYKRAFFLEFKNNCRIKSRRRIQNFGRMLWWRSKLHCAAAAAARKPRREKEIVEWYERNTSRYRLFRRHTVVVAGTGHLHHVLARTQQKPKPTDREIHLQASLQMAALPPPYCSRADTVPSPPPSSRAVLPPMADS